MNPKSTPTPAKALPTCADAESTQTYEPAPLSRARPQRHPDTLPSAANAAIMMRTIRFPAGWLEVSLRLIRLHQITGALA